MNKAVRFEPTPGTVYENKGGGTYRCVDSWQDVSEDPSWHCPLRWNARMVNTKSGWSIEARGLWLYPDGTIEWDYSTGGRFEEVAK